MTVLNVVIAITTGGTFNEDIIARDRSFGVTLDEQNLAADAGLILSATLVVRLGLESLVNQMVRLNGRVGGARPGRRVLTRIASILAGWTHIDCPDRLRAGRGSVPGLASPKET